MVSAARTCAENGRGKGMNALMLDDDPVTKSETQLDWWQEKTDAGRWEVCTLRQRNGMFRALGMADPQKLRWGYLPWEEIPAPYKEWVALILKSMG